MAFSWQESTVASGTQNITCDIEYLDKSYIHVYLDGEETTAFSWTSDTVIRLDIALAKDTVVLLIRKTEREYLYIMFASGAPFIEANVDSQNKQFLHLAQELVEGRAIDGFYGDISMHGYRITNLGSPESATDAANKAYVDDTYAAFQVSWEVRFQKFLLSAGYQFLGDYEDGPLQFSARNQYIRYDGQYYRLNADTDIGFTTTGTDAASFANDVTHFVLMDGDTLRQELASETGASLIGGLGYTSPEMFGYKHGVTPDAVPYLQAAVDYGHEHKIPIKWSGDYYTTTAPVDVPLPGDDGTAYPGWVSSGTDANIPEETKHSLKAALRIYSDTKIIGSGSSQCRLIGPWDAANPVIDNQQHVGIYIQANNPIEGYVRYQLSGLTIKGYFVGRFCSNILNHSYEDDLILLDCCFPGIFLGADAVKNGFVTARGCWAAEVYGGWWTNRNAAVTTPYLPPYPAAEIFKIGWVDSLNYEKFAFYGRQRVFGATDIAIDNWFDTYIYKSANSPTTSSGGRRTNNTASGFSSRTFRGVANRAFAVFSRYGRGVNAVTIGEFKSLCTSRVPVYSDKGSQNSVGKAYVERAGLVDTTTSSTTNNEFYVNYTDPRDATYSVPPAMVGQGSMVVDRVVVSAGVATNPYSEAVNESSGPRRFRSFRRDNSDYNMLELSEWNSSIGQVLYRYSFNREFSVQRPVRFFGEAQEAFQYLAGTWTPVVQCGSEVVAGSIATGTWRRVGNLVHVTFRFETSTMSLAAGGAVVISGLPFTVAALNNGGLSVAPVICSRAGSAVILAETVPGGKTIALLSASSPTAFAVTGGTGLTIYGSIQYVLTE